MPVLDVMMISFEKDPLGVGTHDAWRNWTLIRIPNQLYQLYTSYVLVAFRLVNSCAADYFFFCSNRILKWPS
jgi:hypothetical protein